MAIISEVNAVCDLVAKTTNFISLLRDGFYKASAELDSFPAKVLLLRMNHDQWNNQLKRFGLIEDHHLKPLLEGAAEILDKEEEYVEKMKRSRLLRFKRRAFPGKLTRILDQVLVIVNASSEMMAKRNEDHLLLARIVSRTPALLPFDKDRRYVPLIDKVTQVQNALEDPDGHAVVTVYGGPGMGKSGLVKYIGLQYQALRKKQLCSNSSPATHFPDGVQYLFCGKGARCGRLELELLENLGFATGSANDQDDPLAAEGPEEEYVHLPSNHNKLRSCLAQQELLIILDDVWEVEVLQKLVFPSNKRGRYLVTSQIRGIHDDATEIELKSPSMEEARKILANYTKGLSIDGRFPDRIQSVTDAIIEDLERHPLSLVNVGISINPSRATDPNQWAVIKNNLHDHLDNYVDDRLRVYGRLYELTVSASMMLMVDSMRQDARQLFFLFGVMEGPRFQEVVLKFFFNIIQPINSIYKFNKCMTYLEDRSVVELTCRPGDGVMTDEDQGISGFAWAVHCLRTHYTREKNAGDVRSIVAEIVGEAENQGSPLLQRKEADKALAIAMGALYFDKTYRDVVSTKFQHLERTVNGGVIPRSFSSGIDPIDLVERAQYRKFLIEDLLWLLNIDGESPDPWKRQAHDYARKIIIKFICQGELDDHSMARILQLSQTTSTACTVLRLIYRSCYQSDLHDPNRAFSSSHGQTMKTLLDLLQDNSRTTSERAAVIRAFGVVLRDESPDMILSVAEKWVELLAKDSSPVLQRAVAEGISLLPSRASIIIGEFPGVLERLLMSLVEGHDTDVRESAAEAIAFLSWSRRVGLRIVAIPGSIEKLLRTFLSTSPQPDRRSKYSFLRCSAGLALANLSRIPENRIKFREIQDGLKCLTQTLASCQDWEHNQVTHFLNILGDLALEKELKEILAALPEVGENLRLLQFTKNLDNIDDFIWWRMWPNANAAASRALTILHPLQASPLQTAVPPSSLGLYYQVYRGRAQAYEEIGMYTEAIRDLDLAHRCLYQMQSDGRPSPSQPTTKHSFLDIGIHHIRFKRIFLNAMLGNYARAMIDANYVLEEHSIYKGPLELLLGERGVLHRLLGELEDALKDFNRSLKFIGPTPSTYFWLHIKYRLLKHRGLVKHLMGDHEGARADAESAQQISNLTKEVWDVEWIHRDWDGFYFTPKSCTRLLDLHVKYMGFTL